MGATTPDIIIVGGGLCGCVLASRLKQQQPDLTITLLEAGPDEHSNPKIIQPLQAFSNHGTELEYNYKTPPQPGLDGWQISVFGGKLLSGGSAINYGTWTRGHAVDYDIWSSTVNDDRWSYKGQLPYFKRTETFHGQSNREDHGFDGPIHTVETQSRRYPLAENIKQAFLSSGAKELPDANHGYPLGLGPFTENWKDGRRQPAGKAYPLHGVNVITDAVVQRLVLEDRNGRKTATGVELVDGRKFFARREVILSCGAVRTPQVLMLSGIGPSEELQKHNIPQLVEAPDVGRNLHDHICFAQYWKLRDPSAGAAAGSPAFDDNPTFQQGLPSNYILTENAPDATLRKAFAADGLDESTQQQYLDPPRGHFEAFFMYLPAATPVTEMDIPLDGTHITSMTAILLPTSRGRISLTSNDARTDPLIDPHYFSTEADRTMMRAGVRRLLAAAETDAATSVLDGETVPQGHKPLTTQSTDEEIDRRVSRTPFTIWHLGGSVTMGKAVETDLRFRGVQGLRVVDASVIPTPIAAHYQVALYALAEQAADIVAEGLGGMGNGIGRG